MYKLKQRMCVYKQSFDTLFYLLWTTLLIESFDGLHRRLITVIQIVRQRHFVDFR